MNKHPCGWGVCVCVCTLSAASWLSLRCLLMLCSSSLIFSWILLLSSLILFASVLFPWKFQIHKMIFKNVLIRKKKTEKTRVFDLELFVLGHDHFLLFGELLLGFTHSFLHTVHTVFELGRRRTRPWIIFC